MITETIYDIHSLRGTADRYSPLPTQSITTARRHTAAMMAATTLPALIAATIVAPSDGVTTLTTGTYGRLQPLCSLITNIMVCVNIENSKIAIQRIIRAFLGVR